MSKPSSFLVVVFLQKTCTVVEVEGPFKPTRTKVYFLSEQLDEQAFVLSCCRVSSKTCTGVEVEGPFKPTRTRSISCRNSSMSKPSSFLVVVFLQRLAQVSRLKALSSLQEQGLFLVGTAR